MIERFDFLFSYWIFIWFILYEIKIVKYNPKFAFILGIIANIIELVAMIYFKNSFLYIFLFIFLFCLLKIVPLSFLIHDKILLKDIYALFGLFLIYFIWLKINNISLRRESNTIANRIKENKPIGPATYYIDKFLKSKQ
jgi:hypothetical protein